jgi:alkylation response protein AidB-like acyl-CoA dehydrogenase
MRFNFTPEQDAFRRRVREFILKERPPEFLLPCEEGREEDEYFAAARRFMEKLAEAGLLVIGWPEAYGGGGATFIEQAILAEELGYLGYSPANSTGLAIAGPAIMRVGTEEQKQKYLTPIARGEVVWAQGFSEPNSGSDLASVQCLATRDGDEFVIRGQKTFTSRAHWADYIYLLTRTDPDAPKHEGLSIMLVDMKSPGITLRKLLNFSHAYPQNEIFFDDVRVPAENLIGAEGQGWELATASLSFERVNLAAVGRQQRLFEEFLELADDFRIGARRPFLEPVNRERIARSAAELQAWRLLCWRNVWLQSSGVLPGHEVSLSNFAGKDYRQTFAEMVIDILGPYGLLEEASPLAPGGGRFLNQYLYSMNKHGQGTAEVQRDIVAKRRLGLPRR